MECRGRIEHVRACPSSIIHRRPEDHYGEVPSPHSKMTEEPNQNNEWDGHAQQ
jgi:hypothetical protein